MKPCLVCGEPSPATHCATHRPQKPPAAQRGYDSAWNRLSRRARKIQPWCLDCGATDDLQADHSPEAWQRWEAGKAVRLADVEVVCGPCNRARGQARPDNQGRYPKPAGQRPEGKAQGRMNPTTDVVT